MSRLVKNIIVLSLALLYVGSTVFVETYHQHIVLNGILGQEQIQSHDCGSTEQHRSLGSEKHCALCQRVLQPVSIPSSVASVAVLESESLLFLSFSFHHSLQSQRSFFLRGPPVLIS